MLTVLLLGACTSLKPVDLPPASLQDEITAGRLATPGDKVLITTGSGDRVRLQVVAVKDGIIIGRHAEVPIAEVAALEVRESSTPKTALLAGGVTGVVILFIVALSSMAFMI